MRSQMESQNSFTRIVGDFPNLSVAFQATIIGNEGVVIESASGEKTYPALIHRKSNESVVRVKFPSIVNDVDGRRTIIYINWINNNIQKWHFIFRIKDCHTGEVLLGRDNENRPFEMNQTGGVYYIPLLFLFCEDGFEKVFISIKNDRCLKYLSFEAGTFNDGGVTRIACIIEEVAEGDVPDFLRR